MRAKSLADESGTSLTEFAIIAPLIILLIFWAQFFTDLGIFKLKLDEAARYASWEMAAQRPTAQVQAEIQSKFQKLYSPDFQTPRGTYGVLTFKQGVKITAAAIDDQVDAPFGGQIQRGGGNGGGGIIGTIIGAIEGVFGSAVDAIIRLYGFNTKGEAQATTVTFQAPNQLFPGTDIKWLAFRMSDKTQPTITMTTRSPPLLVDTWKAWPSKYNGGDLETSPMNTYGRPGVPEQIVSQRMGRMAFMGITRVPLVSTLLGIVTEIFTLGGLPNVMLTSTWDQNGPVAMLPGAPPKQGFAPGGGLPLERGGGLYDHQDEGLHNNFDSPNQGIDRSRMTTPSAIHTDFWDTAGFAGYGGPWGIFGTVSDGGYRMAAVKNSSKWNSTNRNNPYARAYKCRDAWYMGGASGQVKHWGEDLRRWASALTPACP